jgi:SAM-dependent methyltransferase
MDEPKSGGKSTGARERAGRQAQTFFEELWSRGDPWELETSEFEQAKYERQLELINGRRYRRALEIGCGAGWFTRQLAGLADQVVALDISPTAIARARAAGISGAADFRVQNVMDYDPRGEGPWDVVVLSETIYYLGWLYPFFDVAWLASELHAATSLGGRLLLTNTQGGVEDYLLLPWIIRTYRDLFLNVGFGLEAEELFYGTKGGVDLEVSICLLTKASEHAAA